MKNREETIEQAGAAIRAERERQEQRGREVLKKLCALQRQLETSSAASLESLGQDDRAYDKAEDAQVLATMAEGGVGAIAASAHVATSQFVQLLALLRAVAAEIEALQAGLGGDAGA